MIGGASYRTNRALGPGLPKPALEGTTGQIHATNPFHPGPGDSYTVKAGRDEPRHYPAAPQELSFTGLTRHINAVLRGEEEPRLLAVDTTPSVARGLNDLAVAAGQAGAA